MLRHARPQFPALVGRQRHSPRAAQLRRTKAIHRGKKPAAEQEGQVLANPTARQDGHSQAAHRSHSWVTNAMSAGRSLFAGSETGASSGKYRQIESRFECTAKQIDGYPMTTSSPLSQSCSTVKAKSIDHFPRHAAD